MSNSLPQPFSDCMHTTTIAAKQPTLEDLYTSHRDLVYRVALRITSNAFDAEDVVQTVFLRMMRNDSRPDPSRSPALYLKRAATNASIDLIRDRIRKCEIDLQLHYPAPEETLLEQCHVRQVLNKLPQKHAHLLELHCFGGYMYRELAQHLGMQVGTVRSRLHRIRADLQQELLAA